MSIDFKIEIDADELVQCENMCPVLTVYFSGYAISEDESEYEPYIEYNGYEWEMDKLPDSVRLKVEAAMEDKMYDTDWSEDWFEAQVCAAEALYDSMMER